MELRAERLAFGYRHRPVGHDVDLAVRPGEVLCLLGPNGSGKTTLFKTLLGLLPVQGGRVMLDGTDMKDLPRNGIARRIAYVPQAHDAVFPYSVRDMVLMGRTVHRGLFAAPGPVDRARAESALTDLGIADLGDPAVQAEREDVADTPDREAGDQEADQDLGGQGLHTLAQELQHVCLALGLAGQALGRGGVTRAS